MENYIVRVYRRGDQNPDEVVGIVERVEKEDRQPFHSLSELCKILSLCPTDAYRTEMRMLHEQSATVTPIAKNLRSQ